jgi:hypothetical protein
MSSAHRATLRRGGAKSLALWNSLAYCRNEVLHL